jgi:hypothetical protein
MVRTVQHFVADASLTLLVYAGNNRIWGESLHI